jgi:AcrR family transcriptional regulator
VTRANPGSDLPPCRYDAGVTGAAVHISIWTPSPLIKNSENEVVDPSPPPQRADAARNRQRILAAAREAFFIVGGETSMAEIARRSKVGQATLYRNFATRRELLEAILTAEVDEVCAAARTCAGDTAAQRFTTWLRRFFQYVADKRPVVIELVEHTDTGNPVFKTRSQMLAAGQPLLSAAQDAGEIDDHLKLDQILDLITAIAKIAGTPQYRQPILDAALAGLLGNGGPEPKRHGNQAH